MPAPTDFQVLFAIVMATGAIFLYTRESIPLEASSLAVLLVILVWFELFPVSFRGAPLGAADLLAGFGHEALVTVVALIILARGLEVTNALQPVGQLLARLWRIRPRLALLLTIVTAFVLSMFLNNTPVVAALMPLLVAVSLRARVPASGMLMPVGFATIVGGMATTIGTSTNLLVVSVAASLGVRELQMFDFALPVVTVGLFAVAYLWLLAPRLLPDRSPPISTTAPRVFESRLRIEPGSVGVGRTLADVIALTGGRIRVTRLDRGDLALARLPSLIIKSGDFLHVSDTIENLKDYERLLGATILPVEGDRPIDAAHPLASSEQIAEVVVMRGSIFEQADKPPGQILALYGLRLLAVHRKGRVPAHLPEGLRLNVLRAGDVIVLQGSAEGLEKLKQSGKALVLDGNIDLPRPARASWALAIMAGVVVLAGLGLLRISQAAVAGMVLMLATRCMTWNDVQDAIDRRIVLVIAASLALGLTVLATGAADYVAALYLALLEGMPNAVVLSGLILVMALLTEVATNNAIAVLGTPIAVSIANALGAPAEPFVLAVLFGANMSYLTPVGYQTNLLVMSAGGYRFADFLRAGAPLQLIMWIGLSIALPVIYDI